MSRQGSRKQSRPLPIQAMFQRLPFTAQYSQGSAFRDIVNLPSSSRRSNCHKHIKLTAEKVLASFSVPFPPRKHSYRSRLGCPDGLCVEINNNASPGVSWCQDTQKVYVSQWKGKDLKQGRTQGDKSSFNFTFSFTVVGFILNLTRRLTSVKCNHFLPPKMLPSGFFLFP